MFNVEIREATENKYIKVENKEGFIDLISTLYDTMANDIESRQEVDEEKFWAELLTGHLSAFETKDEFFAWVEEMANHNMVRADFDFEEMKEDLAEDYGKNKYKLHYIYREFTIDFFKMDLNSLPKNASSLKFSKHNAYIMSLCLTFHVNLGLSLRKTRQAT